MNAFAQKHLAKAKEYIVKGDEFYRKARPEIIAAKSEGARVLDICRYLQKSEAWVYDVLAWDGTGTLYGKDTERRQLDAAKQVLRESEPEVVADLLEDTEIKTNVAAAQRVQELRTENRTGIPARNPSRDPSFISLILRVNGWLDELVGMVERGEAEVPAEFSTQSLSDIGVKAMRLKELVDDIRTEQAVRA